MKVSYELDRKDSASAGEFMDMVARGVAQGYYELPDNLRSLVEWCGLKFLNASTITVEVKISKEITILYAQATIKPSDQFFIQDPQQNNFTEFVAKKFKETVVKLVTLFAFGLRRDAKLLEDLAALGNPVPVVFL